MTKTFFAELSSENIAGIAYKNVRLKKRIISYFANISNATIPELCDEIKLSAPKMSSILNELISEGIVQDYGKVDSTGGRRPNLYGINPESGFFIGVDVKQYHINIGITGFQKSLLHYEDQIPYILTNDKESLIKLCQIINDFINNLTVDKEKILAMGMNLSGRINYATGYSYSFFNFQEDPLSNIIEREVGVRTFLENDSRAMAYGEFRSGVVKDEKDVLFLNVDYGLGMGIMLNKQIYYGKSGYSGEFGHIPLYENEIICKCGKKGCLETEASGQALIRLYKERIKSGSSTLITEYATNPDDVRLEHIIDACNNDDTLAIELVAKVGEELGRGIAVLINIFNPDLVILGGSIATTKEYIQLPVRSAVKKYSLSLMNNDTQFKMSELGERAGVIGACLLVRNRVLALDQ